MTSGSGTCSANSRASSIECDDRAVDDRLADPLEQILEERAVFGLLDRRERRAEQPHAVSVEDAALGDLDGQVEPGLPAERRQQPVRPLALDDAPDDLGRQRLDVDGVGDVLVGHDRGRVGVDQDRAHALFAQGAAGLGAGVVELGRLADDDRTGAEDEDALRRRHRSRVTSRSPQRRRPRSRDQVQELVEQVVVVLRPGRRLGMELDGQHRQIAVGQSLDRAVVEIDQRAPPSRRRVGTVSPSTSNP